MSWQQNLRNILSGNNKVDRKLRKFLYGVEELPKYPKRHKVVQGFSMLVLITCSFLMGATFWSVKSTGTLPWHLEMGSTPAISKDVEEHFVAEDTAVDEAVSKQVPEFRNLGEHGFVCVEAAFLAAREFWWEGSTMPVPIRLQFEELPPEEGHMLLGFVTPTRWRFFNPVPNGSYEEVYLKPGGNFYGYTITTVSWATGINWKLIEFVEEPPEPEIKLSWDTTPITQFPEFGSTKEFKFFEGSAEEYTLKEQFTYEDDRGFEGSNPTYEEAIQLLEDYKLDGISCTEFSLEAREFANINGFRCAVVVLFFGPAEDGFSDGTHAITVFDTTDKGLVYLEPQGNLERSVDYRGQPYPYEDSEDKLLYVVHIW